jgi:hypothetical protein
VIARVVTYVIIAGLALFVLATTFVLNHGGSRATPEDESPISIHDLSLEPDKYKGDTVVTEGTLGFADETKQYQIVSEGVAVVITGYEMEALRSLEGQVVLVTGRFDFDPTTGTFIDADLVQVRD